MRFFLLLLIPSFAHAQLTADAIIHWEGMVQGDVDTTDLSTGSAGTYDTWESNGNSPRFDIIAIQSAGSWQRSITANEMEDDDNRGTNGMQNDADAGTGNDRTIEMRLPGGISAPTTRNIAILTTVNFNVSNPTGGNVNLDLLQFYCPGGGNWNTAQLQLEPSDGNIKIISHSTDGTTRNGAPVALQKNKTYMMLVQRDHDDGMAKVSIYDPADNHALVGTSESIVGEQNTYALEFISGYIGNPTGEITFGDVAIFYEPTDQELSDMVTPIGTHWVSTTGTATWSAAESLTPLSGTACASIATMNANASPGDTVYIRAGTTAAGTGQINLTNSGTVSNPIIIEAYQAESFTISDRTDAQGPAIDLTGIDYVTFRKIKTDDCQESVDLDGCTWIRFENCEFINHKNDTATWPLAVFLHDDTQFVVFNSCTIGTCGHNGPASNDDQGGVIRLGTANVDTDATRYNHFVDCTLFRGGHDVVTAHSSFNIFDRCFFYNDEWISGTYGNRNFITEEYTTGATIPWHGNNTFRDCLFHRAGDPVDGVGVASTSLRTRRNRMIRCVFVDGANAGVNLDTATAEDNRIAHCVFANNGINTPMLDTGQLGGVTIDFVGGNPTNNEFRNNIFEDNFQDLGEEGTPVAQVWADNWLEATGDPQFIAWSNADLDPDNRYAHNFQLSSGSGAIDNGGWLTTTSGSGASSTSLVVADSYWFTDGAGIAPGDTIQLEGQTDSLVVTAIDYGTHTLTISPAATWGPGDGVAFMFSGSLPDQGAFEWAPGSSNRTRSTVRRALLAQ